MKNRVVYIWENTYPHIISIGITLFLYSSSFHPMQSKGIDALIEGIVTLDSIIIGFVGAIIPIILGMKNESKLVKYVFEKDTRGLFKRYVSEAIMYGLINVCISLSVYLRDILETNILKQFMESFFIYSFFLFMLATYRCMRNMIKLLFSSDTRNEEQLAAELPEENKKAIWDKYGK